jgi:fumarate hydratase class II
MLVTALSSVIGYDKASAIAQKALEENKTLRGAAIETHYISAGEFDKIVIAENMVGNPHKDLGIHE